MTQPPTWGTPPPPPPPGGWPHQPEHAQTPPGAAWGQPSGWPSPFEPAQARPGASWTPPQPPPAPPKKGGTVKWVLGAVALVAVTAVVTASITNSGGKGINPGDGGTTSSSATQSDVASANDKGPVGIITEDPSCAPWGPINDTLYEVENKGWLQRDSSIPATAWTPEIRAQHEAVGKAMRDAADQTVPLAKMTTHRVMRELLTQFIAYVRAYADSISRYVPIDDQLARAGSTAANTVTAVCAAISFGSAAARAALVPALPPPTSLAPIGDVSNPKLMFATPDAVCPEIDPTLDILLESPAFKNWLPTDPQITRSNWSPEQKALTDAVLPIMASTADALEKLAGKSSNPMIQDFILLGVQYRRTYVKSMPTYQASDQSIYQVGQRAPGAIIGACKYAGK
ncbi:hypothetical protein [Mycobacteroides chelonae]|uniref:hypothetical protein n=1 Tax=Mycobacteroides chelonae TaxID=1774 RepID=UPI001042417F|nr:hypothetical protein [Mycobacteroides chelonae]